MSIHVVVTELDYKPTVLETSGRCYWGSGFIPVFLEASGKYYWGSLRHWRCICDALGSDHIHTVSVSSFLINISHSLQEQLQQFLKRVDDVSKEAVSFQFLKRVGDITEKAWDTDGVYVMLEDQITYTPSASQTSSLISPTPFKNNFNASWSEWTTLLGKWFHSTCSWREWDILLRILETLTVCMWHFRIRSHTHRQCLKLPQ
jgi:hypothetical protein